MVTADISIQETTNNGNEDNTEADKGKPEEQEEERDRVLEYINRLFSGTSPILKFLAAVMLIVLCFYYCFGMW